MRIESHRSPPFSFESRDKLVQQHWNIFGPLSQSRHLNRKDIEAIVEILPKLTRSNHLFKVAMGRGDNPNIGLQCFCTTNALEASLLQYPEKLNLHRKRHVAYFIEKERATICHFETAASGRNSACEGPFLVAKQFTFEQLSRNSAAVNRDKRLRGACRVIVQIAGNDFFSSTRLTGNEHANLGVGDLTHHFAYAFDLNTFAD